MELKNVTRYYPEKPSLGAGVQYFKSESGEDFYDSIPLFTKRYKLCVNPTTGAISSCAEDVSRLYPVGRNVVEVDTLPEGFAIGAGWRYEDGQVIAPIADYAAQINTRKLKKLMAAAITAAMPLQDAVDLGTATSTQTDMLTAWKQYRVALSVVNLSAPVWPEVPQFQMSE